MIVSLDPALLEQLTPSGDPHTAAEAEQLDGELARAVRHTALMRRLFYLAVLIVALYGTATGVAAAFHLPWWTAIGGVVALELGSVTFLSNADVRRRVGEHATTSRLLGAAIAAAAATCNVATHGSPLLGGFYALMSLLGFASWWLDVENKRRDRLRARGMLPPPTPRYELWGHWIRHPATTSQARRLAKAHPRLGLHGSLEAAVVLHRRHQRDTALAGALRTRIRAAAGRQLADIAVLTYDLDEVARRLRATADYDGLAGILSRELAVERLLHRGDSIASAHAPRRTAAAQAREPLPDGGDDDPHACTSDLETPDVLRRAPNDLRCLESGPPTPLATAAPDTEAGDGDHTGQATPPGQRDTTTSPGEPAPSAALAGRIRMRIIGDPAICDGSGNPVAGLRAKSLELLVFLAVRRDGAALPDILNAVWPGVEPLRAGQRLSTCLSNLRSIIRGVLIADKPADRREPIRVWPEAIVNTGGHYHLNPVVVTVDWWQFLDAEASQSVPADRAPVSPPRPRIADGYGYAWLDGEPEEREAYAAHP
ncbi:hypothetical protein ACPPVO_35470 [Dactylosporangium sp. McL0621]|uniref:hypothetical protein n=1 Tax=Dactylosporangium sp. McL0621 TaxID=3415678 RepID=UPI003CF897EF